MRTGASIAAAVFWDGVAILDVLPIAGSPLWPANRRRSWIGNGGQAGIAWAGRNEAKTDRQWLAIRPIHRDGYFLFLLQQESHRDNDPQFTLFEFGHQVTHVLEEEGAGDWR